MVAKMKVKIMNVYNDRLLPNKGLKSGWGNAFHVTAGEREVLFDVGRKGGVLMRNIHALGIDVDKIEKVVLSHAHRDHTGGLVSFLKARETRKPLPIIAHPDISEQVYQVVDISSSKWITQASTGTTPRREFSVDKEPDRSLARALYIG
jgi:metal-dependent hydrolase (beta-lactamase superfamily II)